MTNLILKLKQYHSKLTTQPTWDCGFNCGQKNKILDNHLYKESIHELE